MQSVKNLSVALVISGEINKGEEKTENSVIDLSMTIAQFLEMVVKDFNIEPYKATELTLSVGGTYISRKMTFSQARVGEGTKILVKRIPETVEKFGVYSPANPLVVKTTKFQDPQRGLEVKQFSDTAPEYRRWNYGMNAECICRNESCEFKNVRQIVRVGEGFGSFNIVDIYYTMLKCKKCQTKIKFTDLRRCGFCNCRYKYDCIFDDGEVFNSDWHDVKNLPCYMKGEVDDADAREFLKLVFTVEKKK